MMSARGLSFSAISLAATTPVESRTQAISMVGIVGFESLLERVELVVLQCRVDGEPGLLRQGRSRECREGKRRQAAGVA